MLKLERVTLNNIIKWIMTGSLIFIISSCTVSNKNKKQINTSVELPEKFNKTGIEKQPDKWWKSFNDPDLDKLIAMSLQENYNLKSLWDRLEQSRAVVLRTGADSKVKVDASAMASESVTMQTGQDNTTAELYTLGVSASYELDMWGRVRSTTDASKLDMLASEENIHAAAISISAEVAVLWYRLLEQRGQIDLVNKLIKYSEDYLNVVNLRFQQGQALSADVLQQERLLEATKETKIRIESGLRLLEHRLAIILGKTPGNIKIPNGTKIPELSGFPDTGLPSELINRRPDVKSTFLRIQAADKRVASAIANKFPRISLTAGINTSNANNNDLFENWIASLAGNIIMPVLDGDSRKAEVKRTEAVLSESVHNYKQVVLNAIKEVDDAILQENQQKRILESMEKQDKIYLKTIELTKEKYFQGSSDLLRFLTVLANYYNFERSKLTAQRELIEYRINLYRALGGRWKMERPRDEGRPLR